MGKSFFKKKGLLFWLKKTLLRMDASEYNYSELDLTNIYKTIITPEWKYIYKGKTEQLYNLKSDPLELNNLIDKKTKHASQLKEKLFKWVSRSKKYHSKKHSLQPSPEEKERLKALGYIEQ